MTDEIKISLNDLSKDRFKESLSLDKYLVGIRPEHFILDKDSPVRVKVSSVEMIGRYMVVHFDLNNQATKMIVDSKLNIKPNDEIGIAIDYSSIYIFEEDGKRVY